MAVLTEDQRQQAIDEYEEAFLEYVQLEKTRLENEVEFLKNVLEGRTGGAQAIQLSNVQAAAVFTTKEINDFLGV